MMIHEMQQVVWVTNETLGDGVIMAIIDYGAHQNSVLMVGFESGDIKFLDTNQVKLTRNDTLGIGVKERADRALRAFLGTLNEDCEKEPAPPRHSRAASRFANSKTPLLP